MDERENAIVVNVGNRGDMTTVTVSVPKDVTGAVVRRAGIFVGAMAGSGCQVVLLPDRKPTLNSAS